MKITPTILKRYSNGQATKEEIRAVELWIQSGEVESEELVFPAEQDKHKVRSGIEDILTKKIILHQHKEHRDLKSTFAWYASAACLIAGFWINGFYQNNSLTRDQNVTAYDNLSGRSSKSFSTSSGLIFTLAPHSKAMAITSFSDQKSNIHFCGTMEITNRSGKDIKLVFSSDCKKSKNVKQTITCKEGKSYVALHHNVMEEIIVVNRSRISDLPGQVII